MNRKRREANVRRAMAAGRRAGPTASERVGADLLRDEMEVPPGTIEAPVDPSDARATSS